MKFKFVISALIIVVGALTSEARDYRVLKTFAPNGLEGVTPVQRGVIVNGRYYGKTERGGAFGRGTIYSLNLDGSDFRVLRNIGPGDGRLDDWMTRETSRLLYHNGRLYGALSGSWSDGTSDRIYSLNLDGSDFKIIKDFLSWGSSSGISLHFEKDGYLYGLFRWHDENGGVFRVRLDGTGYEIVHQFRGFSEGSEPRTIVDGGRFIYGSTNRGGPLDRGILFSIQTDSQQFSFTKLADLLAIHLAFSYAKTSLVYDSDTLYFSSESTGPNSAGGIFHMDVRPGIQDSLKPLYNFVHSRDKVWAPRDISVKDGTIYGLTRAAVNGAAGAIFSLDTKGSNFRVHYTFRNESHDADPENLSIADTTLVGQLIGGGINGTGSIFSFNLGTTPTTPPPVDWFWSSDASSAKPVVVQRGARVTLGVSANNPGATYQWFKDGRRLAGQTNPNLIIAAASLADAGRYHVVIGAPGAQAVVSQPGTVIIQDLGLLIYSLSGNEVFANMMGSSTVALTGFLVVDRENQQFAEVIINQRLRQFRIEENKPIRVFSTGPLPRGSRTVFAMATTDQDSLEVAWVDGVDAVVALGGGLSAIAPRSMRGQWGSASAQDGDTELVSLPVTLTLHTVQTRTSRSLSENLASAVNRLRGELGNRGLREVFP